MHSHSSKNNYRYANNQNEERVENEYEITLSDPSEYPPPGYATQETRRSSTHLKKTTIENTEMGNLLQFLHDVDSAESSPSPRKNITISGNTDYVQVHAQYHRDMKRKNASMAEDNTNMKLEIESLVNARKRDKVVRKQEKEKGQEHLKVQETKHEAILVTMTTNHETQLGKLLDRMDELLEDKETLTHKVSILTTQFSGLETEAKKALVSSTAHWNQTVKDVHKMYKSKKMTWRKEWKEETRRDNSKLLERELKERLNLQGAMLHKNHASEKKEMMDEMQKTHDVEIKKVKERVDEEYSKHVVTQLSDLRDQIKAGNEEREKQLSAQQARMEREAERGRDVIFLDLQRSKDQHEDDMITLKRRTQKQMELVKKNAQAEKDEMETKLRREMESYRRSNSVDCDEWKRNARRELETEMDISMTSFEKKSNEKQEEKIEVVRQKLDDLYRSKFDRDRIASKSQLTAQLQVYEKQLSRAAAVETAWQDKYDRQLREGEAQRNNQGRLTEKLQKLHDKLEIKNEECKRVQDALNNEQNESKKNKLPVKQTLHETAEIATRDTNSFQIRVEQLEQDLVQSTSIHTISLQEATDKHNDVLRSLNDRVRMTVQKKDNAIKALQEDLDISEMKYQQSKAQLEEQRRLRFEE